ncbi:YHYH protein [Enhygromyxa salina]|uniref:YHYH protein n=1 Tax=Enhygromyxa salina TaxID=215803 RepID=UPI001C636070|nr:YHYH protein [Enhygromyxa salina]
MIRSLTAAAAVLVAGCDSSSSDTMSGATGTETAGSETSGSETSGSDTSSTDTSDGGEGLHPAFAEFDVDNTDIYLDGDEVVLETNGLPNHTSPYWGSGHELYEEPVEGWEDNATPSLIPGYDGSFTLRVPGDPEIADTATETPLDVIGLSVSGAAIFNEQEGMGILTEGVAAGLDYSGGHIGPSRYHYHTEPKAITNDDDTLVGVLTDGFFIYGRKCASTGDYPDDLDAAGGHTSTTQHTDTPEYHYHIENILFLDSYYIIFDGDFQGSPGTVQ